MRIAINARFLLSGKLEGIGVYSHEILQRLVKLMPDAEFIFLFDREYSPEFIYADNIIPVVVSPPARHPLLWYYWFEKRIPSIIKKYRADVFFSPDGFASLHCNVPQLLTIHDVAFEYYPKHIPLLVRHFYTYFTPKYCAKVNSIITVSQFTAKEIISRYGINPHKITVAYNGCSSNFVPLAPEDQEPIRSQYTDNRPYFIFVGAIHPRKNPVGILNAYRIFRERSDQDHKLLFVGRRAWRTKEFERALLIHPYRRDILLIDEIEREEIPKLLASATALLYPSYYEGFGLPVLEAMACGTPAITTENSPMAEIGKDAVMKVHPDSPGEMAGMMLGLASNPTMRKMLAIKGIMRREGFWWDEAAEKIALELRKLYLQK